MIASVLAHRHPRSRNPTLDAKRVFDVALASAGLVVSGPFMVVIGLAVRWDSEGPAMFRQERVGRFGEVFCIHKFRTMRAGAAGPPLSRTSDPRITRVGAVLRRTKLDELPQLLDVLAGHMSLVGPRPELPQYVALWPPNAREVILSVRPGITDPASIEFRNEAAELEAVADAEAHYVHVLLPRKVTTYVQYVESRSLAGDLRIIGRTLRAVLQL